MEDTKVVEPQVDTTKEPTPEQVELSKEELAKRRKEISDYYKENIKHLTIQLEYEQLLMNIEKTRAERIQAQMFLAQAAQGTAPGQPSPNEAAAEEFSQAQMNHGVPPEIKRTLKREQ